MMERESVVLESMLYIDRHLAEELTVEEIAGHAGYSVFHFSRMFREEAGVPVMEYVRKRRLIRASEDILGGRKVLDAALDWGYQSHSGFTKAFTGEFGFPPALLRGFRMQMTEIQGGNAMSHVFLEQTGGHESKEELYDRLWASIGEQGLDYERGRIEKAYEFACRAHEGQKRYSGDEYVTHPINVAILLTEMEGDEDTVVSGLLSEVLVKTEITTEELEREFSPRIVKILEAVKLFAPGQVDMTEWEAVLVKLAGRLHNMRTLEAMSREAWEKKARETVEWYLPIARAIGNEKLAAELHDLSLKYLGI